MKYRAYIWAGTANYLRCCPDTSFEQDLGHYNHTPEIFWIHQIERNESNQEILQNKLSLIDGDAFVSKLCRVPQNPDQSAGGITAPDKNQNH